VAVTVTVDVPAVVGVPEIVPVAGLIESPAGRPVAPQVRVADGDESVPTTASGVMAVPETLDWLPGLVTTTVFETFHVKVVEADSAWLSVAVTVTDELPAVVGVPVMAPVEALMASPEGRPVAEKLTVLPPVVSWGAEMVRVGMADPDVFDCVPGLVTERLSTFQVREIEPLPPVAAEPPPLPAVEKVVDEV
jgi:hypothetical protein